MKKKKVTFWIGSVYIRDWRGAIKRAVGSEKSLVFEKVLIDYARCE